MGIEQSFTCDCCGASMPSIGIIDAMTTMALLPDSENGPTVEQRYYCEAGGCAPRIRHAIGLELNKHEQYHNPTTPTE